MSDINKKPNRSYNDLLNAELQSGEFRQAMDEAVGASDRASVLLFTSHLDISLTALLKTHLLNDDNETLVRLYRQGGVLSSFGNKIILSFALGIISSKTQSELDIIRKIRNAFAHSALPLTFDEFAIRNMCLSLDYKAMSRSLSGQEDGEIVCDDYGEWSLAKRNFTVASIGYISRFQNEINKRMKQQNTEMRLFLARAKLENIKPEQFNKDPGL